MFEDINEIAENCAYLQAVSEEYGPNVALLDQLPPYEQLAELEKKLKTEGKTNFDTIYHEPTGNYLFRCFLAADYSLDKAAFYSDVEVYRTIRDAPARLKVLL